MSRIAKPSSADAVANRSIAASASTTSPSAPRSSSISTRTPVAGTPHSSSRPSRDNSSTAARRVPIILLAVVVAPVTEELAFRGYLYGVIKRYLGAIPALVLSGILFALIHLNLPSFFPLLVLASVFALAYELSGSLLVPMTMHALFNAFSLILVLLGQK